MSEGSCKRDTIIAFYCKIHNTMLLSGLLREGLEKGVHNWEVEGVMVVESVG